MESESHIRPQRIIKISVAEYRQLVEDSLWLEALEIAGVEAWDGYDRAGVIFVARNKNKY